MNRSSLMVGFIVVLVALSTAAVQGQRRERNDEKGKAAEGGEAAAEGADAGAAAGMGMALPANPLMQVLDLDGDGELSKKEIGAAAKSLKKLDANRDGKLSPEELMPGAGAAGMGMGGNGGAGGGAAGGAGGAGGAGRGGVGGFGGAGGAPGFGGAGGAGGAGGFSRPPGSGLPPQATNLMGFDSNRDGRVTRDELPAAVQPLFERLDLDRNGQIDPQELRAAAARGNAGAGR